jgi:hypothetical protein
LDTPSQEFGRKLTGQDHKRKVGWNILEAAGGRLRIRIAITAFAWIALPSVSLFAQSEQQLRTMLDSNQAFALRDAVRQGRVPAFYRGAVAESQNRLAEAKRDLDKAIAADPHSKESFEAHEMLANMNFRQGFFLESLV